jgi:starvation-inducible DNA-binding protein
MHMPLYVFPAPVRAADLKAAGPISVAAVLNAVLAECFALYLKTRSCQMRMLDSHAESDEALFGRQADALFRTTEAIAERVGQTGASALFAINVGASAAAKIGDGTIGDGSFADPSLATALTELRDDNVALVEMLWQARAVVEMADDMTSAHLIDVWTDEAEKRAWLLIGASGE